MQTKYILVAVAVVAAIGLISLLRSRSTSSPSGATAPAVSAADLTEDEQKVLRLVRDVYGDAILSENFVRQDSEVTVQLSLDPARRSMNSLAINLTSLARKQKEEGLSDGALKRGVTF
jgi:hypothetical protein